MDFTISVPDLDALGFGTEGVAGNVRPDEAALKTVPRTIQVALVVAATAYSGSASTEFKLSKKQDTGQLLPSRTTRR